ncbi:MAG: O-antigen ligase family protein [Acidobacteria bacterium]|nr:O-antigen ligase family protein [Acidobacteriota bacterium]
MTRARTSPAAPAGLEGWAWSAALFLLALAFVPGLEQPGEAPRRLLLLTAAPLLLALAARRPGFAPSPLLGSTLAVVSALGLAGLLRSPAPERGAVLHDLALLAGPWLLALTASSPAGAPVVERALRRASLGALAALGLLGLAQAWLGFDAIAQARAPAATFVSRVPLAEFLVVLVPLAAWCATTARTRGERWVAALGCGLGAALLFATRSRGGAVAAAVGWTLGAVLAGIAAHRKGAARWRIGAPALAALSLAALGLLLPSSPGTPLPSLASRFRSMAVGDRTIDIRAALARNTLVLIADEPLWGVGAGRFPVVYPLVQARARATPGFGLERQAEHAENDALELATELGVPAALGLFALLLGALARSARDALRGDLAAAARTAALTGVLVHGLVGFPLRSPATAAFTWTLVGLSWCAPRAGWPAAARHAATVLGLAGAALGGWVGAAELHAQMALGEAIRAQAAGDCDDALARAGYVARSAPWLRRERGIAAMVVYGCEPDGGRSLAALEPALALHPNQVNLLLGTGARRLKVRRFADAEALYAHALAIDPRLARAHLGLAMARDGRGDGAGARAACAGALPFAAEVPEIRTFCQGNGYVP